jgi:uncharacterized protein (TIGR02466 family)
MNFGHEVIPLFSSPVYIKNLGLFQTADELMNLDTIVNASSVEWASNHNNNVTNDNRWLDSIKETKLYSLIQGELKQYFYSLMQANPDIEIYITESWLNKSEPGQEHHRHRHANSIISGVYYFNVNIDSGNLMFSSSQYQQIEYTTINSNIYNSKHWIIIPKQHNLILFPSSLEHKVSKNNSDTNRISLSFNTFIKGPISNYFLQSLEI